MALAWASTLLSHRRRHLQHRSSKAASRRPRLEALALVSLKGVTANASIVITIDDTPPPLQAQLHAGYTPVPLCIQGN